MFIELEGTVYFWVQCLASTGVPTAPDAAPAFKVYEGDQNTPLVTSTLSGPVDSNTGYYKGTFAATAANGFERGQNYDIRTTYAISSTSRPPDRQTLTVV